VYTIIFDTISAYANSGLSLGYPGTSTSTAAIFHDYSKVVLMSLMIYGYCAGISPTSLSVYELPSGVEGPREPGLHPACGKNDTELLQYIAEHIKFVPVTYLQSLAEETVYLCKKQWDSQCTSSIEDSDSQLTAHNLVRSHLLMLSDQGRVGAMDEIVKTLVNRRARLYYDTKRIVAENAPGVDSDTGLTLGRRLTDTLRAPLAGVKLRGVVRPAPKSKNSLAHAFTPEKV
jgi:hypothetical protein